MLVYLQASAQTNCSLSASPLNASIICGQSVQLNASGAGGAILMHNDFNNGTVGAGWSASASAQFDNPCGTGLDGTTHLWMGGTTAAPRTMTTIGYNIACSGNICFDLEFASTFNTPCEQPDLSTEGVDIGYSTDGGVTWTSIFYFDPTTNLYNTWARYCFAIPAGAISPNTMFSWTQTNSSGADFDHWGIDNVDITLTGSCATAAPYYYSWLPTTGLSNPSIANPVATPTTTTTYTLYFTNGIDDTCMATVPITVAGPTADAGTMQTVCLGQSVVLNGSGASNLPANTTFNSTGPTTINDVSTSTNTITVSGLPYSSITTTSIDQVCMDITHTFDADLDIYLLCPDGTQLELTTDNGGGGDNFVGTCFTVSATTNVTAGISPFTGNFLPEAGSFAGLGGCTANGSWVLQIIDDAGGDVGTLNNWSITFVTPAVTSPSWSPTANMTGSSTFTPTVTPTVPGLTQYTLTVNGNPGCSASDTVSVMVNQLTGVSVAANDNVLCQSDTTTINATGGVSYAWSPATGLSSASISNPVANPNTTTNYTVTVTNGGCSKIDSVLITVNPRPAVDAGANAAQCLNDSTQLNATGADTYTWAPATGLSSTTIANPVTGSTTAITYTVTGVTTATGCFRSDSVTITVNPLPVANAGTDTSFCAGSNVMLNATGGGTYSWLPATNISNSTVANPTVNPPSTTNYTLTVTNSFNCIDKDTIQVTVHALPPVDAGANGFTCMGTPRQLNATGASSYIWTPAATLSNPNISNPQATPTVTTTYTVVGTDIYGCSKSDLVTVGIFTVATVSMSSSSSSVCPGGTATLTAAGTPSSYTWSPAGTLASTSGPSVAATPTATTTYTVQFATPGNGCIGHDSITISMFPVPVANAGTDANICPSDSITLGASGGISYAWSPAAGLSNTGISNPAASPSSSTNYTVTVTDANGCMASDSVWVFARPDPVPGAMSSTVTGCTIPMGSVTMQAPSVGTAPFTYALNGGSPQAAGTFTSLGAGYYVVQVTDSFGCSDTAGVAVSTAPNPVAGALTSTVSGCTVPSGSITMQTPTGTAPFFYSLNGGSPQTSATFSNLAAGSYFVIVIDSFTCADTASIVVGTAPDPTPGTITTTLSACTNATGSVSMQTPPSGTAPFTYALNGGASQTSGTFTNLAPGSYTITVTDANGCSGSASDSVFQQNPPSTNGYTAVSSICTASNGSITVGFPNGGTAPYMFSLNGGTAQSSTVFNGLAANQYTITVADVYGCTDSEVAFVPNTSDTISIDSVSVISSTCGETTGSIKVVTTSGGTGPYTYSVNYGTSYQSSSVFNNLGGNTSYFVIAKDANGCTDTTVYFVGANITVNASFDMSPTSGVYPLDVDFTNTSTNATNYLWDYTSNGVNDATTANTSHTYTAAGTYTVQLIAYHNIPACSDTAWQAVLVIDAPTLTIPNIITPNGDDNNDAFKLLGYNYKSFDVTIFDRWGKKVINYSGDVNSAVWRPDSDVHEGTYFYVITAVSLDDKTSELSGYVTVMR
jgi:gliding motility-associated-like protein